MINFAIYFGSNKTHFRGISFVLVLIKRLLLIKMRDRKESPQSAAPPCPKCELLTRLHPSVVFGPPLGGAHRTAHGPCARTPAISGDIAS